ncbi:MAG TPA: hypothetical protein VJQ54_13550, partial [Candidatus Sulfotelmatobacter sp.]|nr:hypothetical protein [Candidatus Sulfotelmatobacter sp.]
PEDAFCPIVSPNGNTIVFGMTISGDPSGSLVASSLDGLQQHRLFSGPEHTILHCARWAPNGKELLFPITRNGRVDIWTVSSQTGLLHRSGQAVKLTNGPLSYTGVAPTADGKHIFAIGTQRRGELVRYDVKSREFVPFLSGISAIDPTFSGDGQWVAYSSYPDHNLWRSRVDGSERLQLSYPPMDVAYPFISPDGKKVCFRVGTGLYVAGMDGTSARKLVEENVLGAEWSPDSNSLVVTRIVPGKHSGDSNYFDLFTLNLASGRTTVVPSSEGKVGPWWLPDDTLIGVTDDLAKLVRFEFRTGQWSELVSGSFVYWAPSLDSKYMYYTPGGSDPKLMRIRLADRKVEEVTSLSGFRSIVDPTYQNTPFSVAPDGSPVFTRDIGTQEIYALDVKWP